MELTAEQFAGKTIAVVGNSKLLLEQEHGALIDSHDIVIRFNRAWPNRAKNRAATGSKTTHMSLVLRKDYDAMIKRNPHVTFFLPVQSAEGRVPECCKGLPRIGHGVHRRLRQDTGIRELASSGLSVLWFLVNMTDAAKVSVFGMDGMKSEKWYEKKGHWKGHNKIGEREWLAGAVERGEIDLYPLTEPEPETEPEVAPAEPTLSPLAIELISGFELGLDANEIVDDKPHAKMKALRKELGHGRFRKLMRTMIMPNRIARVLERAEYIETLEELQLVEQRLQQAIEYQRNRIAAK